MQTHRPPPRNIFGKIARVIFFPFRLLFSWTTVKFTLFLSLIIVVIGAAGAVYLSILRDELPTIEEIRHVPLDIPLRIYNRDGKLIAEYGTEKRIAITVDTAPPLLLDAILTTEDDRFYHHNGVDFPGLVRATWSNFVSKSRSQGASTITMQVARNFFLTREKTYIRKIKEILLAFSMEEALTKDEILELYLNKIFLGHRAYGFAAAAQVYYGTTLDNLSVPELAMLAGLPKSPARNTPILNPERALERREYVLKRLHELGRIDDFIYDSARRAPITAILQASYTPGKAPYAAEIVRQWMVARFGKDVYRQGYRVFTTISGEYQAYAEEALRKGLVAYDQRHGFRGAVGSVNLEEATPEIFATALTEFPISGELRPAIVLTNDERIVTAQTLAPHARKPLIISIDWEHLNWARSYKTPNRVGDAPESAADVVARGDIVYVAPMQSNPDAPIIWRLAQLPEVSGALVSINPNNGEILALTGGFDFYLSKFNRATQALRQPGSNFKPFIYSAALDHGFTTSSLVSAAPIVTVDDEKGVWRPQNYSRKFFGPTRLRKALSLSLNLVSVRLLRSIGIDSAIVHLEKFGFARDRLPNDLSLALGSLDITPLDMASRFAVFANGGKRVTPYLIDHITDATGNAIATDDIPTENETAEATDTAPASLSLRVHKDQREAPSEATRAISEQNAFLVNSMLQQVIQSGTGRRALQLRRGDLGGKTGTTNNSQDTWFSGFTQDLVTTVFVGFDQPAPLGERESGATTALPIWVDYMKSVLDDYPERQFVPPSSITSGLVNKKTGLLTTPADNESYLEYYLIGTEPTEYTPQPEATSERIGDQVQSESLF